MLAVIVLFILIGVLGGSKSNNGNATPSTQNNQQQEEPALKVSARQLGADYKANQVAADSKYKGKTVEITGTITSIGKDILDTPYVSLNGGDFVTSVQCMFDKSNQAALATLAKDTQITLKGTVRSYLLNVIVENCSIVK